MIERLLETWLNKANERSFQIPFCHALAAEGHTILHLSRHCGMELGKDILTIGPDGIPCAYQLKGAGGGRLSLSKWRDELGRQMHPLVHCQIVHASLPAHRHHRAFVVINGDLDEEVHHEIEAFNQANANAGQPERQLKTILKGELLKKFSDLQSNFWATNLRDIKTYLELMLEDGRAPLNKSSLGRLLESSLPFRAKGKKKPTRNECVRAAAGSAIICASAIANYTNAGNHVAEFEGWTLVWSYILGLAERWSLNLRDLAFVLDVAREAMYSSLERLCDELMERTNFIESDTLGDDLLLRARMTHILGLMGIYGLWRQQRIAGGKERADEARNEFIGDFCRKYKLKKWLWGEAAVPLFLGWNFYFRTIDGTLESDFMYGHLIQAITECNAPGSTCPLPNPYYDAEEVLPHLLGLKAKPIRDVFSGRSWALESLMHLFVRTNLKANARFLIPPITRLGLFRFEPDEKWRYYMLKRRKTPGTVHERFLRPPHRWSELRAEAEEHEGTDLPLLIKQFPIEYLCFLCAVPYRLIPSGVRWLSTALQDDPSAEHRAEPQARRRRPTGRKKTDLSTGDDPSKAEPRT